MNLASGVGYTEIMAHFQTFHVSFPITVQSDDGQVVGTSIRIDVDATSIEEAQHRVSCAVQTIVARDYELGRALELYHSHFDDES